MPTTQEAPSESGTLSLEAGIVYKLSLMPLASIEVRLLDEDLARILQTIEPEGEQSFIWEKKYRKRKEAMAPGVSPVQQFFLDLKHPEKRRGLFYSSALAAMAPHIVQAATTDRTGKAQFRPVPVGTYYVMGFAKAREQAVLWNVKIQIKPGHNSMVLDQNTAAILEQIQ
ncbi:MAG: hypothetical protein HY644_07155 [Acidobacteria bacterium]|nr:hypothetical protein [Acidobacteriota bacterium]